ncbi:Pseudouridine synthase [Wolbachia endosymbiont of Drosophila simulans wNo]|uniref:tRNA pseudouridine(38-40) synthase TruA n=1 Tax=unclassified Wolbachia TaxID=2640676 RepID=UPI0002D24DCC|nr:MULTISPECIES: tRNA pseudouridine(38-40) synthase TruA [unclassified Wolbachia]AGJ99010.1 Pseudouridine synthase [Wolbachia endosymbiont of Drosophila simulans wNo]QCB62129.1 tRNA pseudouridine(38-40) synthase TruA [Wolbachia endosymbiont of Drosophila mauritiana]QCB63175.1 tRNA pseudouridine(38-40) synthase TruA [Wolbachia endosymbiont of Drosophila mauritiana]QWE33597.1 tRNA pseudouridine synthase A [Wolbachia endosymbiont of Drosophila simulans]TGB07425.1 tRNA pseudouridine(38-40) synthas
MRYKITIEYNGSSFFGWQKQQHSANSIQETIENAIFNFSGERVSLHCGGRTDAGVHALEQVAHFDMERQFELYRIRNGINYHLKAIPIVVLGAELVDDAFHARFSAKKRYYEYRIINRYAPTALETGYVWQVFNPLDVNIMREAAKHLLGKHNLSSFCSKDCQATNPVRTIDDIDIVQSESHIYIKISAISFLHNQVRIIVGTLVEFGKNRTNPQEMLNILSQCKRNAAGITAPPYGLYLIKIDY